MVQRYMECMKKSKWDAEQCRDLAQLYLQCRMDKYVVIHEDMKVIAIMLL